MNDSREHAGWTLLSNHGAALLHVAENPDSTVRELADAIGVTERAAARILHNLREEGYIEATRVGRRNTYRLETSLPLRHRVGKDISVAQLLSGLSGDGRQRAVS
ncbi:MAG: MarR family transcriptional regulator [Dehalococcoidia bacterium]